MMRKLIALSAHYKGCAIQLSDEMFNIDFSEWLAGIVENTEKQWKADRANGQTEHESVEFYFNQLNELVELRESGVEFDLEQSIVFLFDVILLETKGYIKGDEHNGMQYIYLEVE